MRRAEIQCRSRVLPLRRFLAAALMLAALFGLLSQTVFAQNRYVITDGDFTTVHKSFSTDPDVVLNEAGIKLSEEDTYTTTYNDGVSRIDIKRMQMVTVIYRGERSVIGTYGETAASLLERLGIARSAGDVLSCEENTPTHDGMVIELVHKELHYKEEEQVVPHETKYYEDPSLNAGEERVLIEGQDGLMRCRRKLVYENGKLTSSTVTDKTVVAEAVTRLVIRGPQRAIDAQPDEPDHRVAQESTTSSTNSQSEHSITGNTITTLSGSTYSYSDVLSVTCTAYSCGDTVGQTATGTVARVGAVAVDPSYIPLGTKMYIVSDDGEYVYGYCVAEDTGGLVKGYKIDLYFDTFDECWDFGVRACTAYILK